MVMFEDIARGFLRRKVQGVSNSGESNYERQEKRGEIRKKEEKTVDVLKAIDRRMEIKL
jgi:hypothetical protein